MGRGAGGIGEHVGKGYPRKVSKTVLNTGARSPCWGPQKTHEGLRGWMLRSPC
jgi:hypothetical protein